MTLERKIVVQGKVGLHARPAALFVKQAAEFESDVRVRHNDREANAKSILEVMALDAACGAQLVISAEGIDALQALDTLERLLTEDAPHTNAQGMPPVSA